jgi:hypothetical protein
MDLPSGKHTKSYGTSPFYSWVNPLFLWLFHAFSITGEKSPFLMGKSTINGYTWL